MFGFKKNKKNEAEKSPSPDSATKQTLRDIKGEDSPTEMPAKKRKRFPLKKLIIMLVAALILVAIGFAVFYFFFQDKNSAPTYPEKELSHVSLPDEMLKFCFYQTPRIYESMVEYNESIDILDQEIQRIFLLEQKYPDQVRITNKEKKIWEKSKTNLVKSFDKVQKSIRELYVLFQVNPQEGRILVDKQKEGLSKETSAFLIPVREQIMKLGNDSNNNAPEGFFARQIYKIKKKFL